MTLDEFARKAIEVRFVEHGRSYDGWDCWGLVVCAYRDVYGIELPEYAGAYETTRRADALEPVVEKEKEAWRTIDTPSPGDVVLCEVRHRPIHIGLALDAKRMIHSMVGLDTRVERLSSIRWGKVSGYYTHVG